MALALPRESRSLDWLACPVGAKDMQGFQPENCQPSHPRQRGEADTWPLHSYHLLISHQCLPLAKLRSARSQLAPEPGKCRLHGQTLGIQSERENAEGSRGPTDLGPLYVSCHIRTTVAFQCQIQWNFSFSIIGSLLSTLVITPSLELSTLLASERHSIFSPFCLSSLKTSTSPYLPLKY